MEVKIEATWKTVLKDEFEQPYFASVAAYVKQAVAAGKTIYPPGKLIFNAFSQAPFPQVKCVLLGQDPYHGRGQANGLCFSVNPGIAPPPSLVNIFKELQDDLGVPAPASGDLSPWARQGVLLLNAILTVEAGQPASHHAAGWEQFTDAVIRKLSEEKKGLVFLLWGKFAQNKQPLIDTDKHHILKAAHPSPFSAHRGFLGCRHFSKTNDLLRQQGASPVDWALPAKDAYRSDKSS